jgi:hypothetical protein
MTEGRVDMTEECVDMREGNLENPHYVLAY